MTKKLWQPFFSNERRLDAEQWGVLEKSAGLQFSTSARDRLQAAMDTYQEHADGWAAAVRPGDIKPLLRRATAALTYLGDVLEELMAGGSQGQAALREIRKASAR